MHKRQPGAELSYDRCWDYYNAIISTRFTKFVSLEESFESSALRIGIYTTAVLGKLKIIRNLYSVSRNICELLNGIKNTTGTLRKSATLTYCSLYPLRKNTVLICFMSKKIWKYLVRFSKNCRTGFF